MVSSQVELLRTRGEICSICMENECVAITPCAHLFCSTCVKHHIERVSSTCPICRSTLRTDDLTSVISNSAMGGKMSKIAELIRSLENEPTIVFVQWKAMVRGMRAFLRGMDVATFLLDGNSSQRAVTLQQFTRGGVLILCLEDSFAGLHLPHARHVLFAHAIVGDRERVMHLERQAIARCVRHGQTGEVRVYSFVIADCVEEKLWRRTHEGSGEEEDMCID
jgi:SNF2 family DNA or RNA helicase